MPAQLRTTYPDATAVTNFANVTNATNAAVAPSDEKIDVAHIRLVDDDRCVAMLGEFRAADRLLVSWKQQAKARRTVEFEITFNDGCVLCGRYRYGESAKRRPSLSAVVRHELALLAAQPSGPIDWSRYAVEPF
jgi:hypothetical protein